MSIARLAVGSKAVLAAKSITRAVTAQSYQSKVLSQGLPIIPTDQRRHLTSTTSTPQQVSQKDIKKNEYATQESWERKAYKQDLQNFKRLVSTQANSSGNLENNNIKQAMEIYDQHKESQLFTPNEISHLIQGIHTNSRRGQKQLANVISARRAMKRQQHSDELMSFMDTIANDIQQDVVKTTDFGMMQMLTSYLTMQNPQKGYEIWEQFLQSSNTSAQLAKSPKVVGAVIDLMVAAVKPIEEIENIYKWAGTPVSDINLEHALCRAYIFYERIPEALKLFGQVVRDYPRDDYYLSRIHETFVGDCSNVEIAKEFFYEAMSKNTPYSMALHPSATHRLMERCWAANKDVDEIFVMWKTFITNVAPTYRERMFNILSYSLLTHFFENNPSMTSDSYAYLKTIISTYSEARQGMSPIFLNTLLTLVPQWKNSEVTLGIIETFDLFNITKQQDSYRVILNSLENIETEQVLVESIWSSRLQLDKPLEVYDWGSLAKACNQPERHSIFKKLYLQASIIDEQQINGIRNFLARPYTGTPWAADVISNA